LFTQRSTTWSDGPPEVTGNPLKPGIDGGIETSMPMVDKFTAAIKMKPHANHRALLRPSACPERANEGTRDRRHACPPRCRQQSVEEIKTGGIFFSCAETDNTFPAELRHKPEGTVQPMS